ncbi:MAG: hypothetical protein ACPGRZ_12045 [Alphaproteobacteria bacterium]
MPSLTKADVAENCVEAEAFQKAEKFELAIKAYDRCIATGYLSAAEFENAYFFGVWPIWNWADTMQRRGISLLPFDQTVGIPLITVIAG